MHDIRPGVLVAPSEHARYPNLRTFDNVINEPHTRRLHGLCARRVARLGWFNWDLFGCVTEAHLRKALVVIQRQDVVAVAGDVELGVGLPWGRPDHDQEIILAEGVATFQP